jgi:DNA-binding transcriptional MerR regulator
MKMRELEERTGVNRESIRILVRKGLIPEPERPRQTVAHYTEKHVRAILAVKELQLKHRLKLDEIGEVIRGKNIDVPTEASQFSHLQELVSANLGYDEGSIPLRALKWLNPHVVGDAKAFQSIGLIKLNKKDRVYTVSRHDAQILAIWGKMREAGFVESTNFYPEMLDHYVVAAEALARDEVDRFLARTEGRIDEDEAARMLTTALPLMMDLFAALRIKFLLRNLEHHRGGA